MLLNFSWRSLIRFAALLTLIAGCAAQSPTVSASPSPEAFEIQKASSTVEKCVIRMAKVNDPESPLNVRSTPTADSNNIVGQLKNGTFVEVQDEKNGWFKIGGATPGWIARSRTEHSCNEKVERVNQTSIEIRDRFIGTGSHRYRFNFTQGQRITVNSSGNQGAIFPVIVAPSGKAIVASQNQTSPWTGELAETGEYTFQFESNFKGYEYTFSVDPR